METQDRAMDLVQPIQSTVEHNQALFSHDPERAYKEAQRLVSVVANRCTGPGYVVNIRGKQYPKIEWWTSVSASLGLFPRVLYSKRLDRDGEIAYEAKVEVHRNGIVMASGEAMCSSHEARWQHADEYAIKSMSITRASGKAYRIPLSFLAVMAGLEVTPAEEMPQDYNTPSQRNRDIQNVEQAKEGHVTPLRKSDSGVEMASDKQKSAVRNLIENDLVHLGEKRQIHGWLEDGLQKIKAKELLDFYFGASILVEGSWVKTGAGELERRSREGSN
jgi:hypothetical protein